MTTTDSLPNIDDLWNYSNPAATEEVFRELLATAVESGREDYLAELQTQIARTQGLQGRYDDARETLSRVEDILGEDQSRATVRMLLERGRVLNSSGNPSESQPYFLEAFELGIRLHEEFLAIDAAHMLGIVEPDEVGLAWNERGIDLAKQATDSRAADWQGSLYNNSGWTHHDHGRYEKALENFQASLAFETSRNKKTEMRIASWTVARCLRSLGRSEEAFTMQEENLKAAKEVDAPDGFIQEELGECLLALGREADSQPHFRAAYALLSQNQWLVQQEPERLARLQRIGDGSPS